MRIQVQCVCGQSGVRKDFRDARAELGLGDRALGLNRLPNNLPRSHSRVEGANGILEDHLNLFSPGAKISTLDLRDVHPLEQDLPAGGVVKPRDEPAERRLPRAGLSDQADRFPFLNLQ